MLGAPQATNGIPSGATVENSHIEIMDVAKDKPAAEAGLQMGDIIVSLGQFVQPKCYRYARICRCA
jgi:predicted metalloprotease with PDZ domain